MGTALLEFEKADVNSDQHLENSAQQQVAILLNLPGRTVIEGKRPDQPWYTVFHTDAKPTNAMIGPETLAVHIAGFPTEPAIQNILASAPNLLVLRIQLSRRFQLSDLSRQLCQERGILIVEGHSRPELVESREIGRPYKTFHARHSMVLSMTKEQLNKLHKLVSYDIREATFFSRYFCLQGEMYRSQATHAVALGVPQSSVSGWINAVLLYLGLVSDVGERARGVARQIESVFLREQRKRRGVIKRKDRRSTLRRLERTLEIPEIPLRFFSTRNLAIIRALAAALRDGRLDALKETDRPAWEAITWGFWIRDGQYRNQAEVAQKMNKKHTQVICTLQGRARRKLEAC